jgi:hypothetical protein
MDMPTSGLGLEISEEAVAARQRLAGELERHGPQAQARKERQSIFLGMIANGRTVKAAAAEVGIAVGTYHSWRKEFPEFRSQVDAIRMGSKTALDTTFDGGFISFRKKYFGMDTYWHQREIINAIETAKPGEIVLVNVPPEHGKTTVLEDWCNYMFGMDPNVRITYISEGLAHARKILGRIANRMIDARVAGDYIARFGPFKVANDRRPWSADFFRVWKSDHDERDYSMEARGWKSRIAGTRTDWLLIDDMQSTLSLNQTMRMIEVFRQDMLTRPGREGHIVIVGTRVGIGDIYDALVELELVRPKNHICLPAMRDGESLCPEMWPKELLEERRRLVGEDVWWRTYMQAPRQSMDATFTDDMVTKSLDITRRTGEKSDDMVATVCGLDPALAGHNALHVAAYNADTYQVLDIDDASGLARVEAILERVEKMALAYHFDDLIVEANAYQKGLGADERLRELSRIYGFRIHTHQTGKNKVDDAIGVARMPNSFIEGSMSIPAADEATNARMLMLLNQLRGWRADIATRHLIQDQVMAMWFCWLFWQKKRRSLQGASNWQRQGTPWKPASMRGWQTKRGAMR